jgi:hypothetical protein
MKQKLSNLLKKKKKDALHNGPTAQASRYQ